MKSDEEKDEVPKDKADRKRVKKTPKPAAKKLKKGKLRIQAIIFFFNFDRCN